MRTLTDGELDIIREQEEDARPNACGGWGCVDGCGDCAPACPFCSEAHAPGKCPVAAAMTGAPLIAGLKQEVAKLTAEHDELRQLCHDAKDVINGLQKRLADKGLLGIADDLNGFYNGTGTDGWNVQVCMRLIDATTTTKGH